MDWWRFFFGEDSLLRLHSGIYEVRRRAASTGVEHRAIADVGNRLGLLQWRDVFHPHAVLLVHQTPPALASEYHPDGLPDEWTVVRRVTDEASARARFPRAAANPRYDPVLNNCEHFASEIATGERQSPQLRGWGALMGFGVALWWLGGSEN
jgi:hypothetical protein